MPNGTELHNELCRKFKDEDYSRNFLSTHTEEGCKRIQKVTLEDIVSNNNILIGFCDVVIEYEDEDGKNQCVSIEVKSSADVIDKDSNDILRQIKKYKFYNKKVTKSFLFYSGYRRILDANLFTDEGIIVVCEFSDASNIGYLANCNKKEIQNSILTNSIDMEFALIPAGCFIMGVHDHEFPDKASEVRDQRHRVTISKSFYLGKYLITQEQYKEIVGKNPSYFQGLKMTGYNPRKSQPPNLPVESVSWDDVQYFISRLNYKDNTMSYRLPTEAEWEYAARSGSDTKYWYGDDPEAKQLHEFAWYKKRSTNVVGELKPNAFGLYDMYGNVYEWVADWGGPYPRVSEVDPMGPSMGSKRVVRGGCFFSDANNCSSDGRGFYKPEDHNEGIGFRIVAMKK
jgi:formylglycine-generating enzyme required for sulfatase activity